MPKAQISEEDRAAIDAISAGLDRTFAEMDEAFARAGLGHFLDLIEDGEVEHALRTFRIVDPDFDSATTGICS